MQRKQTVLVGEIRHSTRACLEESSATQYKNVSGEKLQLPTPNDFVYSLNIIFLTMYCGILALHNFMRMGI